MWTGLTELCKAWRGSRWVPMVGAAARRDRTAAAFLNHDLSLCLVFQRTPYDLCITACMFQCCLRSGSLLGRLWPNHVFQTCLFPPRLRHHHSLWGDVTGLFLTGMSGGDLPGVSGCPWRGYLGVLRGGIWVSSGEEQGCLGVLRVGIWVFPEGVSGCLQRGYLGIVWRGTGVSGCPQSGYLGVLRGGIWVTSEGITG